MAAEDQNKTDGNLNKFYNYSFPKLAVLATLLDKSGKPNIITLAWHSAVSIKPPMYGISIDPRRYSHDGILENGEFVINFCDWSIIDQVHYCGRHSGRKFDKFAETGLTPKPAHHTWFVGEVVAITCDPVFEDDLLKEDIDPLYYLGNNEYTSFHKLRKKF
jgi:flavin reductase (DIM6/NTAB) family NADH-FMN oxidoreductase RutF